MSINISSVNQSVANTTLLNYLTDDDDDSLLSTLISAKRAEYEATLEKYGYGTSTSSSSNSNYEKLATSNDSLLDAISTLSTDSLYTTTDGEEYDNSSLLTSVNNFVTAYNTSISNLTSTGGALYSKYFEALQESFAEQSEELGSIGLSIGSDGKISINQDTLAAASAEDVQSLLGSDSSYMTNIQSTLTAMNSIISTALSYSSSYTSSGTLSSSLLSTFSSSI